NEERIIVVGPSVRNPFDHVVPPDDERSGGLGNGIESHGRRAQAGGRALHSPSRGILPTGGRPPPECSGAMPAGSRKLSECSGGGIAGSRLPPQRNGAGTECNGMLPHRHRIVTEVFQVPPVPRHSPRAEGRLCWIPDQPRPAAARGQWRSGPERPCHREAAVRVPHTAEQQVLRVVVRIETLQVLVHLHTRPRRTRRALRPWITLVALVALVALVTLWTLPALRPRIALVAFVPLGPSRSLRP